MVRHGGHNCIQHSHKITWQRRTYFECYLGSTWRFYDFNKANEGQFIADLPIYKKVFMLNTFEHSHTVMADHSSLRENIFWSARLLSNRASRILEANFQGPDPERYSLVQLNLRCFIDNISFPGLELCLPFFVLEFSCRNDVFSKSVILWCTVVEKSSVLWNISIWNFVWD